MGGSGYQQKDRKPKQNEPKLSIGMEKDCAKSWQSPKIQSEVNTEESAVKRSRTDRILLEGNLNPSDGRKAQQYNY
ncbi:hypothetical protein Tco_1105557 [Tanacetum coccineum]